jgi:hypothetical protein
MVGKAHSGVTELPLRSAPGIATPPGSFAEAAGARHIKLVNTVLGQFAYAQSVLLPEGIPPTTPASPPQSAGRPAPRRQAKKKRKKR